VQSCVNHSSCDLHNLLNPTNYQYFNFSWYHGKLDRSNAEERLHEESIPGSYLVRESERKAGSYVLSFLSENSGAAHFRQVYFLILY